MANRQGEAMTGLRLPPNPTMAEFALVSEMEEGDLTYALAWANRQLAQSSDFNSFMAKWDVKSA
jgi:hypothetical protein